MKRLIFPFCAIWIGLSWWPLYGDEMLRSEGLKMAAGQIAPGEKIRVEFYNRTTLQGRMVEADTAQFLLRLYISSGNFLTPSALGADSIAGMTYWRAWQFKPQYVAFGIGGGLVGAVVGQVIEGWIDPGGGGWKYREDGRNIGALAGFVTAIFISAAIPSAVDINFR